MDIEDLRLQEYMSEQIVSAEESSFHNFRTDLGLEAVENIYDSANTSHTEPESFPEKMIYRHLEEEIGMVREVDESFYIAWDVGDIEIFRERLEQHLSGTYDRPELVAHMRNEYNELGESPTQTHFRNKEGIPSPMPYKSRYGDWNSALFMSGLPTDETDVDLDILEHELIIKTHEMNEDSDIVIETPSARQIDAQDSMHGEKQFRDRFGSIEEAFESAGLSVIRSLDEKDESFFAETYRVRQRR